MSVADTISTPSTIRLTTRTSPMYERSLGCLLLGILKIKTSVALELCMNSTDTSPRDIFLNESGGFKHADKKYRPQLNSDVNVFKAQHPI